MEKNDWFIGINHYEINLYMFNVSIFLHLYRQCGAVLYSCHSVQIINNCTE